MSTLEDIGEHDHTFLFPEERNSHLEEHQQLKEEQEALEAEKEEEENDEKKGDFDTLNMYMQYLFITLVPIFILLILSSVGVINQTGAAIIIVAILVVMMLINYRSIAKALAEEEEEEEPEVAHYHDGQGRMYTGEQIFNDPYNPTTTTGSTSTTTGSTTTTSGPIDQITCPNGKYVWQNYLDKYGLLTDSGSPIEPPSHMIKKFKIKYTKSVDDGSALINPVQIDEIELFKYVASDPDGADPIKKDVYSNTDGITNIMNEASISLDSTTSTEPGTLMTDLSLNKLADQSITEGEKMIWNDGYTQTAANPAETIRITLNTEQNRDDLYALVIYTPDDQCLGGAEVDIINDDVNNDNTDTVLETITLSYSKNIHIIKFGSVGDITTIKNRGQKYISQVATGDPPIDINTKIEEYTTSDYPTSRQDFAVNHWSANRGNLWNCTTETFTNMPLGANYSSKTLFSNDDLPKKINFN
jgi:hypothetical protein